MAINLTKLSQNIKNGELTPKILTNISSNSVQGFWFPCSASLTPWNTHLGSEEYEPNARWFEVNPLEVMNLYLGTPGKTVRQGGANPYEYGFITEIKLDSVEKPEVKKRYAMGRASFELGVVMPDERTVYLADDASDGVRLMFIADNPRDLTSGTLYAAKWQQTRDFDGGQADLKWIKLGQSDEKTIKSYLDKKLTFSDIFELKPFKSEEKKEYKISSHTPIYVFQGYTPNTKISNIDLNNSNVDKDIKANKELNRKIYRNTKIEYLKIKQGMKTAAAFLETRRFAALKGATTEFTKMEGQAINKKDRKLYTAISKAYKGMIKGNNGTRLNNDIRLNGHPDDLLCGVIYESDLEIGIKDTDGNLILSEWVATNMKALIKGESSGEDTCNE
ncbi:MAG: alkaline phosphatase PhoX, partial [Nitrospinota bacterium]|nr:alkaline phosphatase PhoX [Nitrospinota bacterium]